MAPPALSVACSQPCFSLAPPSPHHRRPPTRSSYVAHEPAQANPNNPVPSTRNRSAPGRTTVGPTCQFGIPPAASRLPPIPSPAVTNTYTRPPRLDPCSPAYTPAMTPPGGERHSTTPPPRLHEDFPRPAHSPRSPPAPTYCDSLWLSHVRTNTISDRIARKLLRCPPCPSAPTPWPPARLADHPRGRTLA